MPEMTLLRRLPVMAADLPLDGMLTVTFKPPIARFVLRGGEDVVTLAGAALGLAIPVTPMTSQIAVSKAALWLGPDEWLLLLPQVEQDALARRLQAALAGTPYSLVDVSHRQVAFAVRGRLAARMLTSGCPLDLGLEAFPTGMVTRTLFHKAEVVLWREAEGFHLEVWRSFAPYVAGHMQTARLGAEGLPDEALP
jgi:sarcosine oxidase, subunit gamma